MTNADVVNEPSATEPVAASETGASQHTGVMTRRALVRTTALVGGGTALGVMLTGCASGVGGKTTPNEPFSVAKAEVPVGGGIVLPQHKALVTQPTAGDFHAFSAVCTHQGCLVSEVQAQGAFCGCHSSYFDISSGAPVAGPAQAPLPALTVAEEGDQLRVS